MAAEAAARQADGISCRVLSAEEAEEVGAGGKENRLYIGGLQHYGDMASTFHSGKYLFGLARGVGGTPGVSLFENSRVVEIAEFPGGVSLVTAAGHSVRASHCILAGDECLRATVRALACTGSAGRARANGGNGAAAAAAMRRLWWLYRGARRGQRRHCPDGLEGYT